MRLAGRVVLAPFGPGAPLLETEDGARYALATEEDLPLGVPLVVFGELAEDLAGLGMTGEPLLRVTRWERG